MSNIVGLGQIQKTAPTPWTITWKLATNKFEALSNEILFGPGMVTRFTRSMLETLHLIDEYFYKKMHEVPLQESNASFLLPSPSHSHSACYYSSEAENSSRENSRNQVEVIEIDGVQYEVSKNSTDSEKEYSAIPNILTNHPESFAQLFTQKAFYHPVQL
jgi:hypothetical protein